MPKKNNKLYKIVRMGGEAPFIGGYKWSLPKGRPGKWHHVIGTKVACYNGLHLTTAHSIPHWLEVANNYGLSPVSVYEAEIDDPEPIITPNDFIATDCYDEYVDRTKVVVSHARLIRRIKGAELDRLIKNAKHREARRRKKAKDQLC